MINTSKNIIQNFLIHLKYLYINNEKLKFIILFILSLKNPFKIIDISQLRKLNVPINRNEIVKNKLYYFKCR